MIVKLIIETKLFETNKIYTKLLIIKLSVF